MSLIQLTLDPKCNAYIHSTAKGTGQKWLVHCIVPEITNVRCHALTLQVRSDQERSIAAIFWLVPSNPLGLTYKEFISVYVVLLVMKYSSLCNIFHNARRWQTFTIISLLIQQTNLIPQFHQLRPFNFARSQHIHDGNSFPFHSNYFSTELFS